MHRVTLESAIGAERNTALFEKLYGRENVQLNRQRYFSVIDGFTKRFGHEEFDVFSSPGRVEIGGNHTDHNGGKVLAGSISLDCLGVAAKTKNNHISIVSENYQPIFSIDIDRLGCKESGMTIDLVKGLIEGFKTFGKSVGGFDAYISSNVIAAAGVSSSASFEMLLCSIMDHFFNGGHMSKIEYALIGNYAENHFWNKKSGLMDQMACAVGGIINIDFRNGTDPKIRDVDFDFEQSGYDVILAHTGKGHADLSEEYSFIPQEMREVAGYFGKSVLAEVHPEAVFSHIKSLRDKLGDRTILRAMHFFDENERVEKQVEALENGEFEEFLDLVSASGDSSWKLLQNCYSTSRLSEQSIPIALALTSKFLTTVGKGALRIHGGGFAGAIMAIIPKENTKAYMEYMKEAFFEDSVYKMTIRQYGAVKITGLLSAEDTPHK